MEDSKIAIMSGALSDENRVRILRMLASRQLCACNILSYLGISQPTLSYHMKILCEAGFVNPNRKSKWTYYSLNTQKLAEYTLALGDIGKSMLTDIPEMDCEEADPSGELPRIHR